MGALHSVSKKLKPQSYEVPEKSNKRVSIFVISILVFLGIAIFLIVYSSLNRSTKNVKDKNPTFDHVKELLTQNDDNEIQSLACNCKKAYNLPPLNQSEETLCLNVADAASPFISLCSTIDPDVAQLFKTEKLNGDFRSWEDFITDTQTAYESDCETVLLNNENQAQKEADYFKSLNVSGFNDSLFSTQLLDEFWIKLAFAVTDGDMCSVTPEEIEAQYSTVLDPNVQLLPYEAYYNVCVVDQCTYLVLQSDFDVFLAVIAYLGSIYGIIMTVAGVVYATTGDRKDKGKGQKKDIEMKGIFGSLWSAVMTSPEDGDDGGADDEEKGEAKEKGKGKEDKEARQKEVQKEVKTLLEEEKAARKKEVDNEVQAILDKLLPGLIEAGVAKELKKNSGSKPKGTDEGPASPSKTSEENSEE